jgi:hypothetical protein
MGSKPNERRSALHIIFAGLMALTAGACTAQRSTTYAGPAIQVKPDRVQVVSDVLGERLRLMVAAVQPDTAPAGAAAWLATGPVLNAQVRPGHVALLVPDARE